MTAKPRVALVSIDDEARSTLGSYLKNAGFDVHEYAELVLPSSFGALVLIGQHESSELLVAHVRSWLKLAKTQRVIVVTSRPTALKDLVVSHGERLYVLAAPIFAWEVVDALRAANPTRPRGT